ncbi:MAG: 3-deoxy-7-phosphoheptulonate synthase [Planctomycetota bacterium]|jgi:3-deoxy-7-phosphoheptulonate synthase
MFVVLKPGCGPEERVRIVRAIETAGLSVQVSEGHHRIVIGVVGDEDRLRDVPLERYPGVEKIVPLKRPYRLVSRETHGTDSVVQVGQARVGGDELTVIAGPCAVENEEMLLEAARAAKGAGAQLLRGGAFKPRTSPYDFQGLGERGLRLLRDVGSETGMAVVTEAMDTRHIARVAKCADMIQIGTRNMQNYPLLRAAAETKLPVLLKRGRACTITEWLCAAEYLLDAGNAQVVLCERGVVSFDTAVRNLLDLSSVPLVKRLSHLPVVVDPSHGTGRFELVPAMARAAIAAGADGVMIEVHAHPERALSDARQALLPKELERLVPDLVAIRGIVGQDATKVVG